MSAEPPSSAPEPRLATAMSQPTTPVPAHASLPAPLDSPQAAAVVSNVQSSRIERAKYQSPAPASSSMTPPPSSQMPKLTQAVRTPSPPTPHLSSPPPTNQPPAQLGTIQGANVNFTKEQIDNANPEQLRSMVNELASALREVRTSAAHYQLQYNLLSMDSSEASNRMAVELAMAQKEVEALQQSEERRRTNLTPMVQETPIADTTLINQLTQQNQSLQSETAQLRESLVRTRRTLDDRDGELLSLHEENVRLKSRIRKNREHMNALLEHAWDGSPPSGGLSRSTFSTPRRGTTGGNRPQILADTTPRGQQPFEALLLADKVLSQDRPTTPPRTGGHGSGRARFGHTRGAQSLSSLPSTPTRPPRSSAPFHDHQFRTPPTFQPINAVPASAPTGRFGAPRRRESSDSTITASSEGDEEVAESQASQVATNLLRRSSSVNTPGRSFGSKSGKTTTKQSKLFGQITKPGLSTKNLGESEKRRFSGMVGGDGVETSPSKKGRHEGVGLGIGGIPGTPSRR
jgi:hypothetical protein